MQCKPVTQDRLTSASFSRKSACHADGVLDSHPQATVINDAEICTGDDDRCPQVVVVLFHTSSTVSQHRKSDVLPLSS